MSQGECPGIHQRSFTLRIFLGEKHWINSFIIPKKSNTGTIVEKSEFLQLEFFSGLCKTMPQISVHHKTQRRRVSQARWHKSLRIHGNRHLFPHPQEQFTKFPPSLWEWAPFYILFTSKTRREVPCDSS